MSATRTDLTEIKLTLANKYERLARQAGSRTKQRHFMYKANRYRRQAENIARNG